jgi:hypothetical protein
MSPEHDLPDDDNGEVLRRLEAQGDDLTRPSNIDFTVVFPAKDAAEHFAAHFRKEGYVVSVEFAETVKELPWDVIVVRHMTPSHRGISEFETTRRKSRTISGGGTMVGDAFLSRPKSNRRSFDSAALRSG